MNTDTQNIKGRNPWLGLEAYREGEVLYGRDDDIRELSQCVINYSCTLLYGRSGIGKSSILNAGVIPATRRRDFVPVLIRLTHKRDSDYLGQIREAVEMALCPVPLDADGRPAALSAEEQAERRRRLSTMIREVVPSSGDETVYEYFHRHTFHDADGRRIKLLVIFDQFEEVFTLQDNETEKKDFFLQLADMLNDIMPKALRHDEVEQGADQEVVSLTDEMDLADVFGAIIDDTPQATPDYVDDNEVHLVFTIREDFLSEFEYYTSAIPSLKQNRYGLRPINEEQAAQIIMRPRPGLINEQVATLIIQKVTGRTDFILDGIPEIEVDSAVLSLYLNRLYEAHTGDVITADLVEAKGGEIISDFYKEAIAGIRESTVEYLESMLLNGQGRRDNITIYDAQVDGGVTQDEIDTLCNSKKILRQFYHSGVLRIEYIHDILCPVVRDHREARERQRQQALDDERRAAEQQRLIEQQRRMRRRFRRLVGWGAALILAVVALVLLYNYWANWTYSEYYTAFTRQNGWPVGVGEKLSDNVRRDRAVYYKLTRKGRNPAHPFYQVSVCGSDDALVRPDFRWPLVGNNETDDVAASRFAQLVGQIKTIRFVGETTSRDALVNREIYYGENMQVPLFAINYMPANIVGDGDNEVVTAVWGIFIDSEGLPMVVRDNNADRMKIFLTNDSVNPHQARMEQRCLFYDAAGNPVSNDMGCYGLRMSYDALKRVDSLTYLDRFSNDVFRETRRYVPEGVTCAFQLLNPADSALLRCSERTDVIDNHGHVVRRFFKDPVDGIVTERLAYDSRMRIDSVAGYDAAGCQLSSQRYVYAGRDTRDIRDFRHYAMADGSPKLVRLVSYVTEGEVSDSITCGIADNTYRHIRQTGTVESGHMVRESLGPDGTAIWRDEYFLGPVPAGRYQSVHKYDYDDAEGRMVYSGTDSMVMNAEGRTIARVLTDADGMVERSMGYEYRDGVEVARYALSVDGKTPIRCADWEVDHLIYHKLQNLRNNDRGYDLAYIEAVSEYPGTSSLAYFPDGRDRIEINNSKAMRDLGQGWQIVPKYDVTFPAVSDATPKVLYVHLLRLGSPAWEAGLRDSDLVLSQTAGSLTVARYADGAWSKHTFSLPKPSLEAGYEVYPVAYTAEEYEFYCRGIAAL